MKIKITLFSFFLALILSCKKQNDENPNFVVYEVNPKTENLKFYWKDDQNHILGSLENLQSFVESKNETLKFAMNGGMFAENQVPKRLYIEDFKILNEIDTLSGEGNFYMMPNGIFLINKDKSAEIITTENFKFKSEIKFATQSGPMLLVNGKVNSLFQKNSKKLNIRNAVGIRKDGSLVFAMSKKEVNFYEIAEFFKSKSCVNALYLDGFVSRTYLPEKNWVQKDGNFGVMIGVAE